MNRRILLIDADPAFRTNLSQHLGRYRLDVVAEPDADEAIALGATVPPALIIVAVEEPEKAGFKVFQRLKKGPLAKTPVMLITATVAADSFAKHRGLKVHADEYLDKRTLSKDELLGKIDNLIGLGDASEEDDIPVEVDDIALGDGDVVLDEEVVDDDDADHRRFDQESRTVMGGPDKRIDVDDDVDDAFEALTAGGESPLVRATITPPLREPPRRPDPEPSQLSQPIPVEVEEPDEAVPGMIADGHADDEAGFDTFSHESRRPPTLAPDDMQTTIEAIAQVEDPSPQAAFESSPAIMLDSDDLQPIDEDSGGVPEPVPHPMSATDAADAAAAREEPKRSKLIDAPTVTESRVMPIVDLGLDAIAEDARSEQSGVYDRKALRKIGELERQIAQLKTELDRARASADAAARGGGREREFLNLREQITAKDNDLRKARADVTVRERELAETQDTLRQVQQAKAAFEAKSAELAQRLATDGAKVSSLEAKERSLAGRVSELVQELEAKTAAHAAAESARAQLERDLANEGALRESSASEAEQSLRAEREQLIARHHSELQSLRQELGSQHAAALETMRHELDTQHAGAIAAAIQATRTDVSGEAEQAMSQLEAQHAADVTRLREVHLAALASVTEERDTAIAQVGPTRDEAVAVVRQEHMAAMAQRDGEHATAISRLQVENASELKGIRDELDAQLVASAAAHDRAVTQLTAEVQRLTTALERAGSASAQAMDELQNEHATELVEQANQHAAVLAAREAEHARARQHDADAHGAAMAERESELASARQHDASVHAAAFTELQAELARQAVEHGHELGTAAREREQLIARNEAQKAELVEEHARATAQVAASHAEELGNVTDEKQHALAEIERITTEHRAAIDRVNTEHRAAIERQNRQHEEALADHKAAADREAAEFRTALLAAKRTLEETTARAQAEREALEQEHAQTLAETVGQHERAMAVKDGEIVKVKAIADAESRTMKEKDAEHVRVHKEITVERDELKRGLSAARDTIKRSEAELATAVQTIADRNAELRSHVGAIAERDQRIVELRKEIESLEQENANYQEQVLRAYQKIKTDEAMVARAKKAMAIALTVLDDQGNPKSEPT